MKNVEVLDLDPVTCKELFSWSNWLQL